MPREATNHGRQSGQDVRRTPESRGVAGEEQEAIRRQQVTATATAVLLFIVFLGCFLLPARPVDLPGVRPTPPDAQAAVGVDPNTAEWQELAQLPGMGPALAKRVVEYREQDRTVHREGRHVFQRPADLFGVRGLGAKKVERLGRFLRFPRPPSPR